MEIGDNLKRIRLKRGLSQNEVADKLNISRQAVSKWERNISSPDIETLEKLRKLYDVSFDELITQTEIDSNASIVEKSDNMDIFEGQENRIIHCLIIIGMLVLSCSLPFLGIIISIFIIYFLVKIRSKSILLFSCCFLAIFINTWNTWAFLNNAFIKEATATVEVVAVNYKNNYFDHLGF